MIKLKKLFQLLGPGLIYAGAAVGVSHLVQSTRAGADFGFDLIWILILANIIKYPFFEFAPRYVSATGKSLLDGYQQIGKWAVVAFGVLTLVTMFAIQAAVTIVTAGLISFIFKINLNITLVCAIILLVLTSIVAIGKYKAIDKSVKFIIVLLAISTIVAVTSGFGSSESLEFSGIFNWSEKAHIYFLIAFVGWMPSPIDASVWTSLWSVEKRNQLGFKPRLKQSFLDFKIGYISTTFLAICFLSLGALIIRGSGTDLSPQGAVFAGQLISLYTKTIGEWAFYIIAIAAIATMVSTTLTCLDAYPRVLQPTTEILFPSFRKKFGSKARFLWLIILVIGTIILLVFLSNTMGAMVDIATTLSFVTAPILAFMNYKAVNNHHIPDDHKPSKLMRIFAWFGIFTLSIFTLFFLYYRFII
ncbi:MAG: iron transporter [Bacteroidetes bacterium]|nr:iron transporter [Bacteroidota bacterium]